MKRARSPSPSPAAAPPGLNMLVLDNYVHMHTQGHLSDMDLLMLAWAHKPVWRCVPPALRGLPALARAAYAEACEHRILWLIYEDILSLFRDGHDMWMGFVSNYDNCVAINMGPQNMAVPPPIVVKGSLEKQSALLAAAFKHAQCSGIVKYLMQHQVIGPHAVMNYQVISNALFWSNDELLKNLLRKAYHNWPKTYFADVEPMLEARDWRALDFVLPYISIDEASFCRELLLLDDAAVVPIIIKHDLWQLDDIMWQDLVSADVLESVDALLRHRVHMPLEMDDAVMAECSEAMWSLLFPTANDDEGDDALRPNALCPNATTLAPWSLDRGQSDT